jgi:PhoPQ-activated pathogenicity-related protein
VKKPTALDRYVAAPDTNYHYQVVREIPKAKHTEYLVDMTSQQWLTTNEVDPPLWKHWLWILKPKEIKHSTALLFISGGNNNKPAPQNPDGKLVRIAEESESVVVELRMIPNQPLTFAGDKEGRVEDSLVAYTWDKFLRTGDEKWPARLPMTKSAVRAMDTVSDLLIKPQQGGTKIDHFVVAPWIRCQIY